MTENLQAKAQAKDLNLQALTALREITITFDPSKTVQMASKFGTTFSLILVTLKSKFLPFKSNKRTEIKGKKIPNTSGMDVIQIQAIATASAIQIQATLIYSLNFSGRLETLDKLEKWGVILASNYGSELRSCNCNLQKFHRIKAWNSK